MFNPMQNLWRNDYEVRDGVWTQKTCKPYVYAAVNYETGEIDMESLNEFGDDLRELATPWVWRKFRLELMS